MDTLIAKVQPNASLPVTQSAGPMSLQHSAEEVVAQVQLIQHVMERVMKDGEHYGVVPGCGPKPALLKAGAEKLSFTFKLVPKFEIEKTDHAGGHREYQTVCNLYHAISGLFYGSGVGTCSTMESKYRYRKAKSADELTDVVVPREYWDLRKKNPAPAELQAFLAKVMGEPGKYGTKKVDETWLIVKRGERTEEREENPDLADQYNTVFKMSKKRSLVDAILTATAASDIFTQDVEEFHEAGEAKPEAKAADPEGAGKAGAAEQEEQQTPFYWVKSKLVMCRSIKHFDQLAAECEKRGGEYNDEAAKSEMVLYRNEFEKHNQAPAAEVGKAV